MILIDAIYINSFGGLTILKTLVNGLKEIKPHNYKDFHFLLDDRIDAALLSEIKNYSYELVRGNHFSRKKAYQKNIKLISKIICLANVPPLIECRIPVLIYFHNLLLLENRLSYVSLQQFLLNNLKLIYVRYFNSRSYKWIVQTRYMQEKLSSKLKINKDKIEIIPFYEINDIDYTHKDFNEKIISFFCVTSSSRHKNLKRLIKAFKKANLNKNIDYNLYVTTEGKDINMNNKKIKYLGSINRNEMIKYYSKSHYVILPSLVESFGLPIFEGIKSGSNIILSNINSLKEICKPSLNFDPLNTNDISRAFQNAATLNYKTKSSITIKNEINNFIKLIIRNV